MHRIRACDVRAVTQRELLQAAPARNETVPDPAEGPGRRDMAVPAILRVGEGPGIADLLPEHQGIDRCDG